MVWTAGAGRNIDVIHVEGRIIDYGGDSLWFEVVVVGIVVRQGIVLDGVVMRKARPPPVLHVRSFRTRE